MPYSIVALLSLITFEVMVMRSRRSSLLLIYLITTLVPAVGYLVMTMTKLAAYLAMVTHPHVAGFDRFFALHAVCLWAGYSLFRFVSSMPPDPRPRLMEMPGDDTNAAYIIGLVGCGIFLLVYSAMNIGALAHPAQETGLVGSQVGKNVSAMDRIGSYVTQLTPWLIGLVRYTPRTTWLRNLSLALLILCILVQSALLGSRGGLVLTGALLYFSLRLHNNYRPWQIFVGLALVVGIAVVRGAGGVGFLAVFLVKIVGNVVSDSYVYDYRYWTHDFHSFHFFAIIRFIGKNFLGLPGADISPAEFYIPALGGFPWNTTSVVGGFLFNFPPSMVLLGSVVAGGMARIFDANSDSRYNLAWVMRPMIATTVFLAPSFLLLSSPQIFTDIVLVLLLHLAGRLRAFSALVRPQQATTAG